MDCKRSKDIAAADRNAQGLRGLSPGIVTRRRAMVLALIGIVCSLPHHGVLMAETGAPRRLFYVSFDRWDTTADQAGGSPRSDFAGSLMLRQPQGAFSRAGMRIEPGEQLNYDLTGNVDTRRGTISFWVKPHVWDRRHKSKRITFVQISLGDCEGWLSVARMEDSMLKFNVWGKGLMHGSGGGRAVARIGDWSKESGKWHRIDGVWDTVKGKEIRLYVDGQLEHKAVLNKRFPLSTKGKVSLIPLSDWPNCPFNNTGNTTLIDEVEIWDRPRSASEIAAAYNRVLGDATWYARARAPDAGVEPPLEVEFIPLMDAKAFLFQIELNDPPAKWADAVRSGAAEIRAELATPSGKLSASHTGRASSGTMAIRLSVGPEWLDGTYALRLRLSSPLVDEPIVCKKEILKPETPWLGADVGRDDNDVPSPWTPLKRDGNGVSCWGRAYRFDGPFPASLMNGGKEMLAAPIRMKLECDLGSYELGSGPIEWGETRAAKTTYSGAFGLAHGAMAVTYSGTIEFDGLALVSIAITPPEQGFRVDSLALEVPLKSEFANTLRDPQMFVNRFPKVVRQWDGRSVFASRFKPYLWVGGLEAGLAWMCESDRNWNYEDGAKPCQVVPSGDTTLLRLNIVSKPGHVRQRLSYVFGLQATPVKPLQKHWREFRPAAGAITQNPCANATTIGYDYTFEYISWLVPQEWPRNRFQERAVGFNNLDVKLKVLSQLGMKALPYTSGAVIADNNPVWNFFAGAWQNEAGPVSRGSTGGGYKTRRDGKRHSLTGADPGSWSPFLAYMADGLLGNPAYRDGLAGVYVDNTRPYAQNNPHSGSGYENDAFGRAGHSCPILGMRDLALRLLRVIRKHKGDEGVLWLHAHNSFYAPIHGLGDYFLPGEQYGYLIQGRRWFYMDDLPIDVFRLEMNAKATGVPQVLLHGISKISSEPAVKNVYPISLKSQPTEHIIAMCALHDVPFLLYSLNHDSLAEYFSIVDRTGMVDADFLPYWENNGLRAAVPDAKISAYRVRDRVMALVVNFSEHERAITFSIEPARFGWPDTALVARDERRGCPGTVAGHQVTVHVKGKNYAIVSLGSRALVGG